MNQMDYIISAVSKKRFYFVKWEKPNSTIFYTGITNNIIQSTENNYVISNETAYINYAPPGYCYLVVSNNTHTHLDTVA